MALNRFISKSSKRCHPFFDTLRKNNNFEWTEKCETALQQLKTYIEPSTALEARQWRNTLRVLGSFRNSYQYRPSARHRTEATPRLLHKQVSARRRKKIQPNGKIGTSINISSQKATAIFSMPPHSGAHDIIAEECTTQTRALHQIGSETKRA
ncbi:hypothetical protein ACOSQ4_004877 [Xanthoceras sorbifolium]